MAFVFKLLVFDETWQGTPNRMAFQHLAIWHFIRADDPPALVCQPLGIPITPQDLFRTPFKLVIQPTRFPVAGAMRLQVHLMQNTPYGSRANRWHDAFLNGLCRHLTARPMGNMQALRHRFQTGQLYNLRPLQGGKDGRADRVAGQGPVSSTGPGFDTEGRCDAPCEEHIASEMPPFEPAGLQLWLRQSVLGVPGTRATLGSAQPAVRAEYPQSAGTSILVCDHA